MTSRSSLWTVVCVLVIIATVVAPCAADNGDLAALRDLFQQDPATGFEEAARMFEAPEAAGDLEGMMKIVRVVAEQAQRCGYWAVLDDMAQATTKLARERGDWSLLAEVYTSWLVALTHSQAGGWCPRYIHGRCYTLAHRAQEASDKAGTELDPFVRTWWLEWEQAIRAAGRTPGRFDTGEMAEVERVKAEESGLGGITDLPAELSAPERIVAAREAMRDLRDVDAVSLVCQLYDEVQQRPKLPTSPSGYLAAYCCPFMLLQRGEQVAVRLHEYVSGPPARLGAFTSGWSLRDLVTCSTLAWGGRDDVFLALLRWALPRYVSSRGQWPAMPELGYAIKKLYLFGRSDEATRWLQQFIKAASSPLKPHHKELAFVQAFLYVDRQTPAAYRSEVVRRSLVESGRRSNTAWKQLLGEHARPPRNPVPDLVRQKSWVDCARRGNWLPQLPVPNPYDRNLLATLVGRGMLQTWQAEVGHYVVEGALVCKKGDQQAEMLVGAARLFEEAGQPQLAEQVRGLALALAEGDPKALFKCALTSAHSAAAEGRWENVVSTLEAAVAGQEASAELLQAHLLLGYANRNLGKAQAAAEWVNKGGEVLDKADIAAAERANYFMSLASLTEEKPQQAAYLQRAQEAAEEAGLAPLAEKIADQLAQVAVAEGDLAAAEQILLEIVDRQEQKRERLAFDPRLRQQWFADNIGPYRSLLRVAALKNDPYLALLCAERMRSRVLVDQLAWQKVDMGIYLPPEIGERLQALRGMRREAYGLLQQALGGGTPGEDGDSRGLYMPIRGFYMPIRGLYMPIRGVLEGEEAAEVDGARLKGLLESLAQEETALESAIREAVPAYEIASATRIPAGEELAAAVAQHPDLAVLEYTFCDEGLVAVGMGPGREPRVVLIEEDSDQLWERIGKFRQMIWERKDEVYQEAAGLYRMLVTPLEDTMVGGSRLWIIADGALQLVPFGALGRDQVFLASRMAVATTPSLSLALSDRGVRPQAERPARIVAAPDTGAVESDDDTRGMYMPIRGMYMPIRGLYMPIRGEGGVSSALTAMARIPLPGAKVEGEAIAQRVDGSVLLTGKEATRAQLLQDGGNCQLLHIATHAYADPDFPDFSGLLLAGEGEDDYQVLTAQEVYLWPLQARLVTLSACQTALGKDVAGEGVLGLTRAFIYAGAQDVLCSLWPVSDESTKTLMVKFYEGLEQGMVVEEALQYAQGELLGAPATNHPFYWAGFIPVRGPE